LRKEVPILIIIDAIRRARTEYVVHFLLSAWLETLQHTGRARAFPAGVTLPIRDSRDVGHRLRRIRRKLAHDADTPPQSRRVLEDAARAFAVAWDRLKARRRSRSKAIRERSDRA
jgi:hypothetical protein